MHSLPVFSHALQVVFTPLLTHLTLLRRHREHAMEDLIRGPSERREPPPGCEAPPCCCSSSDVGVSAPAAAPEASIWLAPAAVAWGEGGERRDAASVLCGTAVGDGWPELVLMGFVGANESILESGAEELIVAADEGIWCDRCTGDVSLRVCLQSRDVAVCSRVRLSVVRWEVVCRNSRAAETSV